MRCSMQFPEWRKIPWLRVRKLVAWQKLFLIKNRYARKLQLPLAATPTRTWRRIQSCRTSSLPSHTNEIILLGYVTSNMWGHPWEKSGEDRSKQETIRKSSYSNFFCQPNAKPLILSSFSRLWPIPAVYMDIFLFRTLKTDCAWPDCPN